MTRVAMHAPSAHPATSADPIDAAVLRQAGYATVIHRAEIDSTMDEARRVAVEPSPCLPAVVVADRQSLGRGRQGARWWHAPDSLAASLVVERAGTGGPPPTWSLACGIALAEALDALEPALGPRVRWPNDIEVGGRKLAGILVEAVADGRAIFGIGVNTAGRALDAPPALRARLATIPDVLGRPLGRTSVLAAFLPRLRALLDLLAADPAALVERYRPWCSLTGHRVTLHLGGGGYEGLCSGIASDGSLVLDTPAGLRRFASGSLTAADDVWRGT
jgi:BirA family biotin operon repressor/biotin-[acetyl-CoA-carboxylase] ligase